MSLLPVTVPQDLHEAVKAACGEPYAASYLSGAVVSNQKLLPRTHIAWERLRDSSGAMHAIRKQGVTLVEPPFFVA